MDERKRKDAVAEFDAAWEGAAGSAAAHERALGRLGRSMAVLADQGVNVMMRFGTLLTQEWWVSYSESVGDMIPRAPLEAPIGEVVQ